MPGALVKAENETVKKRRRKNEKKEKYINIYLYIGKFVMHTITLIL